MASYGGMRTRFMRVAEDVSPKELDRPGDQSHVMTAIEQGLADADAGRVIDDEDLDGVLAARLGDLVG